MSTGKYLSLKEAQKKGQLDRFAKAHPNKGDKKLFGKLLDAMAERSNYGKTAPKKPDKVR